jgi:serine/threonine protein kinase
MVRSIGSGTFGEVWMAEAPGGTEVAIKIIFSPIYYEETQRGFQVLELIRGLNHRCLVQTHAYWLQQDRLFIVMELAEGSLRDCMKKVRDQGQHGIPAKELMTYFRDAAEGLDYLHERHVLHRDIKPENILLIQGHAKLADFGLARPLPADISRAEATSSGTPAYMPPEVWRSQIHRHSDQWSLAATYAELRLNRPLLGGKDLPTVMARSVMGDFDLSPLPEAEQQVLRKALATDPHSRYGSCREFVRALEQAMAADLGGRRLWRRLLHVVLGAGAVLGLILLAALAVR